MALELTRFRFMQEVSRGVVAVACACLLVPGDAALMAQAASVPAQAKDEDSPPAKLPPAQLESLVAPIALYPDDLLAQTLAASTYPLELIQLQQWLARNKGLKDKALSDAVAKQPWDPAVQSMAAVPEVVKRLSDDIQWTTDLGNAFLAQQADVMDACQRMRRKAKDKGALESNQQQKVETKVVETKEVIVVQSANPEVIYVPSYSPTVVYPPPVYPYPPIYYPPYYAGAAFVSFGVGMMVGAAFWGGSCCHCGWGGSNVNVNVNNNFNRNANINGGNRGQGGGNNNWSHNSQHRGGAPYSDRATANKYGGSARGDSRQASARQQGAGGAGNRGASPSASDRSAGGGGNRGATPGASDRSAGGGNRGATPGASDRSAGGGGFSDRSGASASSRSGGGSDSIGSRDVGSSSRGGGGYGGGGGGMSGSNARASSSRGSSSMGSRGGGGGGGGRSGGGGGRRR